MVGFLSGEMNTGSETWTVSELNGYIRELFDIDFRLQGVDVTGEISNFSRARSGHLYFTLKDDHSQLKCVMWRTSADRLRFHPEDGDAVLVSGRVSVYEAGGVYQLYAERIEPFGRGNLALAFERLKQKLSDEGLFDPAIKKPLPMFPQKIGIVTSADGAALQDIINVLKRRYPLVSVLVAPTLVQGSEAPAQIVRALRWLDSRDDIDTIIVARGGGSIEDLWAFNDENVARTIFDVRHPIISGVGHETDFTIADFVADLRAPTPSAAAELAVPDLSEIRSIVQRRSAKLRVQMDSLIEHGRWQVQTLKRMLSHVSPRANLDNKRQEIDGLAVRLERGMKDRLQNSQRQLAMLQAQLKTVSPLATLSRGYAIVKGKDGRIIRSIHAVNSGDWLTVQVTDGEFDVSAI